MFFMFLNPYIKYVSKNVISRKRIKFLYQGKIVFVRLYNGEVNSVVKPYIMRQFFKKSMFVFLFGGFVYGALEILWRGYTHPSMLLLGGICFLIIYGCEQRQTKSISPLSRAAVYAAFITCLEFIFGLILNIGLGLDVWDYSDLYFNLCGQICLLFSLLWFVLSMLCIYLCKALRLFFEE